MNPRIASPLMRETLTQMIIHDLRSPLTSGTFYLTMIQDSFDQSDKDGLQWLGKLGSLMAQMGGMIDDILDIGRLEQDSLRLHLVEHHLSELVVDVLDKLGPASERILARGLDNARLRCDGNLVSRILLNLFKDHRAIECLILRSISGRWDAV